MQSHGTHGPRKIVACTVKLLQLLQQLPLFHFKTLDPVGRPKINIHSWQYYTLLEQKAIILIFISIIDINVNLSKNEIDKKINLS